MERIEYILDFCKELGKQMIVSGANIERVNLSVERICHAIDNKENILIYGDFDADGVTSTSVLVKTFSYLGGIVDYYIPDRDEEGHGLNSKALVKLLSQKKPKLVITVDNGISSKEEVKFINSFGRCNYYRPSRSTGRSSAGLRNN